MRLGGLRFVEVSVFSLKAEGVKFKINFFNRGFWKNNLVDSIARPQILHMRKPQGGSTQR